MGMVFQGMALQQWEGVCTVETHTLSIPVLSEVIQSALQAPWAEGLPKVLLVTSIWLTTMTQRWWMLSPNTNIIQPPFSTAAYHRKRKAFFHYPKGGPWKKSIQALQPLPQVGKLEGAAGSQAWNPVGDITLMCMPIQGIEYNCGCSLAFTTWSIKTASLASTSWGYATIVLAR
jgi:hypothetical protein